MKALTSFFPALLFAVFLFGCKNIANYPISEPSASNVDDRIIGKWKFDEDTNKNNFYAVTKGHADFKYHVKFWDRGGKNPTYESEVFFSEINGVRFINVPYWEDGFSNKGYFFLKILEVNKDYSKMTTATVADENMRRFKHSSEVREYIAQNINKPSFYSDTAHFYKVEPTK